MIYMGVDVHKSYLEIAQVDDEGKLRSRSRVVNTPESIDELAGSLDPGVKVAMESCSYFYPLYNRLEDAGVEVKVAHPLKVRLIAESRIKSDKIDALVLAQLLRLDYLPTSYIPPRETRHARDLLRHRISLVRQRTQVKNRVHHLLEKNGVKTDTLGYSDLFGKGGLQCLRSVELPKLERRILDMDLDLLGYLNQVLKRSDAELARIAWDNHQARLLMTIPGVDYFTALLLLMEIGDIGRFPRPGRLCSYVGLVPGLHQSGERTRMGGVSGPGNKRLRWAMVESARVAVRHDERMRGFYERVKRRRGDGKAVVAVACKMLKVIWFMLTRREAYQSRNEGRYGVKLKSLRT